MQLHDLTELRHRYPELRYGQRVWVEVVGGYREMVVSNLRTRDGEVDAWQRRGAYESRDPTWEYELRFIGGKDHGEVWGWLPSEEILTEKPDRCAKATPPIPPMPSQELEVVL